MTTILNLIGIFTGTFIGGWIAAQRSTRFLIAILKSN
jgi:hypothetical protein